MFFFGKATQAEPTYLPEVVHLAVNQRLVLPLDVVNVLDVAGVEVLLHHEAQEAVVWGVGCKKQPEIHQIISRNLLAFSLRTFQYTSEFGLRGEHNHLENTTGLYNSVKAARSLEACL